MSGYTNPTKTATDYVYDHVTYSKTTFVDEATQVGYCKCITSWNFGLIFWVDAQVCTWRKHLAKASESGVTDMGRV